MEYKDALGVDIQATDTIVYTSSKGSLQIGRVVELSTSKQATWSPAARGFVKVPALKVVGARKEWNGASGSYVFSKMGSKSTITKLDNVVVLGKNLPAMLTLM